MFRFADCRRGHALLIGHGHSSRQFRSSAGSLSGHNGCSKLDDEGAWNYAAGTVGISLGRKIGMRHAALPIKAIHEAYTRLVAFTPGAWRARQQQINLLFGSSEQGQPSMRPVLGSCSIRKVGKKTKGCSFFTEQHPKSPSFTNFPGVFR